MNETDSPTVHTQDTVWMADFILKKCFFELNGDVKQKSRTIIGTKFVPPNNCIFMDEVNIKCLEIRNQNLSFDSAMFTIYYSVLLTEKRAHTVSQ